MAYIDTSKVTIPKGFFEDLNVPKLLEWLNNQPAADVVPRTEVAMAIIEDIEMYVLGVKSGKAMIDKTTPKIYRLKNADYLDTVLEYIVNLKKKYTEPSK